MAEKCPLCFASVELPDDGVCPACGQQTGMSADEDYEVEETAPTRSRSRRAGGGTTACPMCGETVPAGARSCEYCGEGLQPVSGRLWRQGSILVMEKEAELPERCVKSNEPASAFLPRNLSWHHPAIFISLVACGALPYIILALALRKTAKISVGLSDEWFARRRQAIFVGWSLFLGSIGMFIASIALLNGNDGLMAGMIILSIVVGLGGAIYGLMVARIVTPTKIDNTHVWLKGVHPDFLNDLPVWEGPR